MMPQTKEERSHLPDVTAFAEHLIEFGANMLKEHGECRPMLVAVAPDGERTAIMFQHSNPEEKQMVLTGLRILLKQMGAVRYGILNEAWTVKVINDPAVDQLPPSKRSDRTEVVSATVADKNGDKAIMMHEILRDQDGKPSLGPKLHEPEGASYGGAFLELLEDE